MTPTFSSADHIRRHYESLPADQPVMGETGSNQADTHHGIGGVMGETGSNQADTHHGIGGVMGAECLQVCSSCVYHLNAPYNACVLLFSQGTHGL